MNHDDIPEATSCGHAAAAQNQIRHNYQKLNRIAMIAFNSDCIEFTNPKEAAIIQMVLDDAQCAYRIENTTLHMNYMYYPDTMTQEEIAQSRRQTRKADAILMERVKNMSKRELKKFTRGNKDWIIEGESMDVWGICFFLEEKDHKFTNTLLNQFENMKDRLEDKQYPDDVLLARYQKLVTKYNQMGEVDHPFDDLNAYYPFTYTVHPFNEHPFQSLFSTKEIEEQEEA